MPPEHALESIEKKRLKISRFRECNDPFELEAVDFSNSDFRNNFRLLIQDIDRRQGLICFSKSWQSSIMWSHYADKHRGVCLGFDVNSDVAFDVSYATRRLYPNIQWNEFSGRIGPNQMAQIAGTKSLSWAYEEEVRVLFNLEGRTAENGMYFTLFGEDLILREVILGPQSKHTYNKVRAAIGSYEVEVFGTRRAFRTFDVVKQRNRSLWPYDP